MPDVKVITPVCCYCGKDGELLVDESQYDAWKRGVLIQKAFPEMSPEKREMLLTGMHPSCWKEVFGDEDDD